MPTQNSAEQALVRRALAGDAEALGELYRLHAPAIFRYFLFRMRDRALAEDLTVAVFLKVVEGLPHYTDRGLPLAAWLFRIAHDRLVDHHRRAAKRPTEPLSDKLADGLGDTEALAMRQADYQRLHEQIACLTDEQRTVIQLRFIEGLGLDDTADFMGKSAGAVKALQHRALRQLARGMED